MAVPPLATPWYRSPQSARARCEFSPPRTGRRRLASRASNLVHVP